MKFTHLACAIRRLKPSATFRTPALIAFALAAVSVLATAPSNASEAPEDWYTSTWHTKEGLPQNTVTAIVQTRDGYLWVGTGGGLARFDGVRFRSFGLEDGLGSVRITALFEDRRGILWVGTTGGGVSRWENGQLTRLSEGGEFSRVDVESLAADPGGTLWIGTRRGLLRWRDGEFTRMGAQVGLPEKVVRALLLDSTGTLWVSVTYEGLFRGTNGHFTPEPQNEWTPSHSVASLLEDQDGSIWAGGPSGQVWQWRDSTWKLYDVTNGVPVGNLRSLARGSRAGEVWVGSQNLGLAYSTNGTFQRPMVGNNFLEQPISAVWVDRDEAVWLGTAGGGLGRLSRRKLHYWGKSESLPNSKVSSVAEDDDGILWVATETAGPWQFTGRRFTKLADPAVDGNYPYHYSALRTGDGSIWMAGESVLLRFRKGQATQSYMSDELWHNAIHALCEDGTNVWLGTLNASGSSLFKCDGTALERMATNGTFGGRIASLVREAPETFWIGCVGGLYRWDKGRVRQWTTQDGLLCADIQALHRDPDGTLWIGTLGGGLARLKDGRIANITKRQGLIDNSIVQILPDDLGHLWLGSSHGIMRLERKELHDYANGNIGYVHAAVVSQDDGMLSEQCTGDHSPTATKTKDGRLLFPTTRGLVEIDPRRFEASTAQMPQADIEEVLADGRSQPRTAATVLAPGVRRLEISYTAPSLQGADRVRFRHRLQPLDEDWINAGMRRTASYGNLAPGKYTFQVTACDRDGVWSQEVATLAVAVLPFYWQTLWFRGAMGLLLVAAGGGAVFWRGRAKRRSELAEMKRQQLEFVERQRADEKFRLAVEASPNGIVLVNREGRMVLVNAHAEKMFGYAREELIGQAVEMLVPERFRVEHLGRRAGFFAAPQPLAVGFGRELFARRKDGTIFPVEIGLNPIETGEETLVLAAIADITSRKRSEQELAQQRNQLTHLSRVNMLGELAGSLAHELNQPLTAVLSNAQAAQRFLAQNPPDLDEVREILTDIVAEDKRAGEVIHRLRLLLKKGEVQHQPLSVNEVVQDVLKLVRSDLVNQNFTAETELAPDLPVLHGDRVQLQQVLLNLVMNACDAMAGAARDHRQLTIRTHQAEDGSIHILVVDCGAGIASEKLDQVFEPFYTTKPHGMGLGLSVCRTIVAAHGGKLWATNNLEQGTTFHISLPVAKPKQA